jgi:hypothetical protein
LSAKLQAAQLKISQLSGNCSTAFPCRYASGYDVNIIFQHKEASTPYAEVIRQ